MKRLIVTLISALAGFAVVAFCGYWTISLLSSNVHDSSVEAAMTSIFAIGPVGAIIGGILGFKLSKCNLAPSVD
ncbi:hypothetical protein [Thermomonas sp.]|uniref:hypothetical protein n=1 Tax=Thermomonas sp. TaxID=1971895 RepID=UPI002489E066|nr:hypothetical protein [Thermomonas sp.]MDI1252320.1 hypothetical protein [Thermomonas sp.]